MRYLFIVVFTVIAFNSLAQVRQGSSRLYISYTPQYYLNKQFNISNDNKLPNPLSTKNTYGYHLGLEYERVTSCGLILNAGFQYGMETHDIGLHLDLSTFDTDAVNSLKGKVFDHRIIQHLKYYMPRLSVGYRVPLGKNWAVNAKLGFAIKYFFTGIFDQRVTEVAYMTDDSSQVRHAQFLTYFIFLGSDPKTQVGKKQGLFRRDDIQPIWLFYIGANHSFKRGWIKNMEIGIEASRLRAWSVKTSRLDVGTKKSWQQPTISDQSNDYYYPKAVSVGLRLAVSLWK